MACGQDSDWAVSGILGGMVSHRPRPRPFRRRRRLRLTLSAADAGSSWVFWVLQCALAEEKDFICQGISATRFSGQAKTQLSVRGKTRENRV